MLHARYPQSFKFLQTLISVQFWRGDDEDTEKDDRMIEEVEYAEEAEDVKMSIGVGDELVAATVEKQAQPLGFTMCCDNVGKKVITRRPNENVESQVKQKSEVFGAECR